MFDDRNQMGLGGLFMAQVKVTHHFLNKMFPKLYLKSKQHISSSSLSAASTHHTPP
jgi:hypothetical protein